MTTPRTARWIKCSTPDCDAKFTSFDHANQLSFIAEAATMGWNIEPALCPDCAAPQAPDDAGDERMLVVPLARGSFTAYAPADMTPEDWRVVAGVCAVMAGDKRPTLEDILVPDWNNSGG